MEARREHVTALGVEGRYNALIRRGTMIEALAPVVVGVGIVVVVSLAVWWAIGWAMGHST